MNFDRRITPFRPDLADESLRGRVDAARFATGTVKRIKAGAAPVHRQPSLESLRDTEALMGELVTVYDEHEGWAWGQLQGDGYVGYVQSELLDEPGADATHKVAAIRTFVYAGPNLKTRLVGALSLNSLVS